MVYKVCYSTISLLLLTSVISSCAVTMAPTDASSLTTEQTTEGSSDFSSNVTFDSGEQAANDGKAIEKFVSANFSRLRSDMSVGQGEHLMTLAVLMSVEESDKEKFYTVCQNNFLSIFPSTQITEQEVIVNLRKELTRENI